MLKHRIKITRKFLFLLLVVIILVVAGSLVFFHSQKKVANIPSTNTNSTNTSPSPDKQTGVAPTSSPANRSSDKSTTSSSTNSTLLEPSGTFVSNHKPKQNGSDSKEESVCNTTPGASCYIQFSKDGVTKKLGAQVTDPGGAAYWTWDTNEAGFSAGSWQITAVATLNGQTKTATDALTLEVIP